MSFIYSGEPPELFNPAFEACGCFLEHTAPQNHQGDDDEAVTNLQILLLLRQDHKSEPNVWGVPGGKLHLGQGETAEEAMARELEEETGLALNALAEPQLRPCGRVYVRYPEVDFVYHMYKARLVERHQPPSIRIDEREHKTHRWATLAEALELPLVRGEVACIELAYPQVKHGYECV